MAGSVTVLGSNGSSNAYVTIPFTSDNQALGQQLADTITQAVITGTLVPNYYTGGALPTIPDGYLGAINFGGIGSPSSGPASITIPQGVYINAIIDNASNPVTVTGNGGGGAPVSVLAGAGGLTFNSGVVPGFVSAGSGTVVAGGGTNTVNISPILSNQQGGNWLLSLGDGSNTINVASGNSTIMGGSGSNNVNLTGSNSDKLTLQGNDSVGVSFGGTDVAITQTGGSAVVSMGGAWHGNAVLNGSSNMDAAGGATIFGGGGSVTAQGGAGTAYFVGGSFGRNRLFGAEGNTTLFGANNGDRLFQNSSAIVGDSTIMYAGAGNETLAGSGNFILDFNSQKYAESLVGSIGGTEMFGSTVAGSTTNMYAGLGADTIVAGSGTQNIDGTAYYGGDLYIFEKGITSLQGGAHITISDFTVGQDTISLQGYGISNMQELQQASTISQGNTTVSLGDGTQVTFMNVTTLTSDPNSHVNFGSMT